MQELKKRLRRPFKSHPSHRTPPFYFKELDSFEEEFTFVPEKKDSFFKRWLMKIYHHYLLPNIVNYRKTISPKRIFDKNQLPKQLKKPITQMLEKDLTRLIENFQTLKSKPDLRQDGRFLCRMATDLKQLSHDAELGLRISTLKKKARLISHLLKTPGGAPYVSRVTFLQAADTFSEQDPLKSDLAGLLSSSLKYGCKFEKQIRSLKGLFQADSTSSRESHPL